MRAYGKVWFLIVLLLGASGAVGADDGAKLDPSPSPEFQVGEQAPEPWRLMAGEGERSDSGGLEIHGGRDGLEYWASSLISFEPGRLYRFEATARRLDGAGAIAIGPDFANRDHALPVGSPKTFSHVFRVPEGRTRGILRLGVWESSGTVRFESVRLAPVIAVDAEEDGQRLGDGEMIVDGRYAFAGSFSHEGSNRHRPLVLADAGFNSNRWVFGDSARIVYRFDVPGRRFLDAELEVNVNHYNEGACVVEVGDDGKTWREVGRESSVGSVVAKLSGDSAPQGPVYVQIRAEGDGASFQVDGVRFEGRLSGPSIIQSGSTSFAEIEGEIPVASIREAALTRGPDGEAAVALKLDRPDGRSASLDVDVTRDGRTTRITSGETGSTIRVPPPAAKPGVVETRVSLRDASGRETVLKMSTRVSEFERTDYGERLGPADGPAVVWWSDASRKIPRDRVAPKAEGAAARLSSAKNDREAVQIIVRADQPLRGLNAEASPLSGPDGASIPADRIKILRAYYHLVRHPTDYTSTVGWWPDALPPLKGGVDVEAGANQPLWVLISVPPDAAPGDYEGRITLTAEGWRAEAPLRLRVYDVTLPERNNLATAFGFYPHLVFRYHGVETEADRRELLDLYFRDFAEHRVSPYNPAPLDPIGIKFRDDVSPPRVDLDFKAFDEAMERAFNDYHFTHFQLGVPGMGGGTYASRHEPELRGHREGSPEYQALFSGAVKGIVDHLKRKDWLDRAYVYWFDEPEPKDYPFVKAGMDRLGRFAPGLPRMLTEEPGPELDGSVDIWCPITPNYDHEAAEERRARGDQFWWYVCTGPKAPFATLFLDHPATDLRVWLWQTWKYKVEGVLIWSTNWWTSSSAFPDSFQDPYEDPMSYVGGAPEGTRAFWGNGDGRFIYPPEAASHPGRSKSPVIEAPVSSIRWEMLREGIEDYELLWMLRDRLAKQRESLAPDVVERCEALLEVPKAITTDMTTFTTDPAPIYERREAILQALESLGR